jgi:hypothetical protein
MAETCSDCCGAPVKVACEKNLVGYTNWFVCTACTGPCDVVPVEIEQEPLNGKD